MISDSSASPQNDSKLECVCPAFDDHRLVANAGLLLPASLARRLGLPQLVEQHLDLGHAPGRANTGDKLMTLVASALAGGDCIDDADALRSGGTARVLGCTVKAPSTLGPFMRSFRWGHVRQLDRVSRELLAQAWAAGAGTGDSPLTIDLDSTICETYGLGKEGARRHGYAGQRGYHPLLAVADGAGEVLMARMREGRSSTARGGTHFLRETVGRVRHAGATGQLTVWADSGFYTHFIVALRRRMKVRFSITVRLRQSLRNLIEAIPEEDWTPIPYWMDGAADVAEAEYTPFESKPGAVPERLIVLGRVSRLLLLDVAQSRSASTGTSRCPTGSTASRASASVTTPSRLGWFSSANITCVAKIWSSSLTTVQPMSTGTELPSASRDRAERLTGTPSLCSSVLGTAVKVDPVSTVTSRSSNCLPCWSPTPMVTTSFPTVASP